MAAEDSAVNSSLLSTEARAAVSSSHGATTAAAGMAYPAFHSLVSLCNQFGIPAMIVTGIVGNLLTFLVFVFSPLKRLPTSVFLAALAFADSGFLVSLGAGWADNFQLTFFKRRLVCACVVYVTYIFSFLSVWLVVCFTVYMYLALFHKAAAARLSHPNKARVIVCLLTVFCGLLYLHTFWTTKKVVTADGRQTCSFVADQDTRMAIAFTDTFLTLILPFSLLIFMNIRIFFVIAGFSRQKHGGSAAESTVSDKVARGEDARTTKEEDPPTKAVGSAAGSVSRTGGEKVSLSLDGEEKLEEEEEEKREKEATMKGGREKRRSRRKDSAAPAADTAAAAAASASAAVVQKRRGRGSGLEIELKLNAWPTEPPVSGAYIDSSLVGKKAKNKKQKKEKHKFVLEPEIVPMVFESENSERGAPGYSRKNVQKGRVTSMQRKSFKMLLTVATVFLLLNLPSHVIRLQGLLRSFFTRNYRTSEIEHLLQQLFQILYYLNFVLNFVIYNVCAKPFRAAFFSLSISLAKQCQRCWRPCSKVNSLVHDSRRIGQQLKRKRELQNSRLVEVNFAELHISKMEPFAPDFKYHSPPCLLRMSDNE